MMKKPQSKFSKTAGKTATRRTPKKPQRPLNPAVFPQGTQHCRETVLPTLAMKKKREQFAENKRKLRKTSEKLLLFI